MKFFIKQVRPIQLKMFFLARGPKERAEYLKNKDVFYHMGNNCFYQPRSIPAEPFLLSFHDNVFVCAGVRFVTHDVAGMMLANHPEYKDKAAKCRSLYYIDKIEIFDNVMIGADAIIMPGVKIGPNAIIGAGSIVTKDVPEGTVVAGCPAKVIGDFDEFAEKRLTKLMDTPKKSEGADILLNYFWKENDKCQK